jgi:hypothetical protein
MAAMPKRTHMGIPFVKEAKREVFQIAVIGGRNNKLAFIIKYLFAKSNETFRVI